MWGNRKKFKTTKADSFIDQQMEVHGDVRFSGVLLVDGTIKGNVIAQEELASLLILTEHGTIEGEVKVPNVMLNGVVIGDVYAKGQIELVSNARITGNVYYKLIEMALGAEVNGNLVHCADEVVPPPQLGHEAREVAD